MIRKPGDPPASRVKAQASSRRRTQEGPDDIVRKLQQRMTCNKKCADCTAKAPQAANLTHGTFVCLTCAGIHREFNHRIKGIGHSSFTLEEATFLSSNGNEIVNAQYLANYNAMGERLRPPNGSVSTVDGQLLRVWLRRKYIDKHWFATGTSNGTSTGTTNATSMTSSSSSPNNGTYHAQATRAQIPPKVKAAKSPDPPADFLGSAWDNNNTASTPAHDAAWDAFGQSRASTTKAQSDPFASQSQQPSSFQVDFSQVQPPQSPPRQPPQQQQQQQQQQASFNPNFQQMGHTLPSTQPTMNANFQQMGQQPPASPQPHLASFNANFQQMGQPPVPSFDATFQKLGQSPVPSQQPSFNAMQQMSHPPVPQNFQQMGQPAPVPVPTQQQPAFDVNIPQTEPPVQHSFDASFQQKEQAPVPPQQPSLNGIQPMGQTTAPQQHQLQSSFNANFQQMAQSVPVPTQQQMGQQMAPQEQPASFNANFQQMTQPASVPVPPQQQMTQPPAPHQQQASFNTNFQQMGQPPVPPPQPQMSSPQQQMTQPPVPQQHQSSFNASFQQMGLSSVPPQKQLTQMPSPLNQPAITNQQVRQSPVQPPQPTFNASFDQMGQPPVPAPSQQPMVQPPTLPDMNHSVDLNQPTQGMGMMNGNETESSSVMGMVNTTTEVSDDPFDAFSGLGLGVGNMGNNPTPTSSNLMTSTTGEVAVVHGTNNMTTSNIDSNGSFLPTNVSPKEITGTKYSAGDHLLYKDSQGNVYNVEVLKVHLDDELVPFYDVKMPDGREKQTDDAHLSNPSDPSISNGMTMTSNVPPPPQDTTEKLRFVFKMIEGLSYEQLEKVEDFVKTTF